MSGWGKTGEREKRECGAGAKQKKKERKRARRVKEKREREREKTKAKSYHYFDSPIPFFKNYFQSVISIVRGIMQNNASGGLGNIQRGLFRAGPVAGCTFRPRTLPYKLVQRAL